MNIGIRTQTIRILRKLELVVIATDGWGWVLRG